MRKLCKTERGEESKLEFHHIQLKPLRGKALRTAHILRTITFLPEKVTTVKLTVAPGTENWKKFITKKDCAFDPHRRIECEIPLPILKKGMPHLFIAEAQKAADAEAKAKRALNRVIIASQAAASLSGTPARAERSSTKRSRDDDSDTWMDEGVQPRSTKQCKTKATPQTARAKASQNNQRLLLSSPIRKYRGLRVPAAIDFMDIDGFDTSLLSDSSVPTRSQNQAPGSSARKVRSSGSNTTTTKKAAVVVDLLDSSDDDEAPKTKSPNSPPQNCEDITSHKDL